MCVLCVYVRVSGRLSESASVRVIILSQLNFFHHINFIRSPITVVQVLYMEGSTSNHLYMSLEFGALYQIASRTMDNSMAPRTTAFLGIAQVLNGTGTCRFLNLKSLHVLTANHFTHAPMNQDAINLLNTLALKY